jgi:hypothetical protein
MKKGRKEGKKKEYSKKGGKTARKEEIGRDQISLISIDPPLS